MDWSQERLAREAGVSLRTVFRCEQEGWKPSFATQLKLSNALGEVLR